MDLPLKVEVSKLSHRHILEMILPFVPGTVISGGLALGSPWVAEQMRVADIGYRTKLFLAVVLTYMIGFAWIVVTRSATDFVLGLIWKTSKVTPWNNPYWRRVVTQYLGNDLMPLLPTSTDSESLEYLAALAQRPGELEQLVTVRETHKNMDQQLSALQERIKTFRENKAVKKEVIDPIWEKISTAITANREKGEKLAGIEEGLGGLSVRVEWRSLHQALMFIPSDVEPPYESISSIMGALQAAAIAAIWVMLAYRKLWDWSGAIFAILLLISATNTLRLVFRMNRYFMDTNSAQTGAMIREMKTMRNHEVSW